MNSLLRQPVWISAPLLLAALTPSHWRPVRDCAIPNTLPPYISTNTLGSGNRHPFPVLATALNQSVQGPYFDLTPGTGSQRDQPSPWGVTTLANIKSNGRVVKAEMTLGSDTFAVKIRLPAGGPPTNTVIILPSTSGASPFDPAAPIDPPANASWLQNNIAIAVFQHDHAFHPYFETIDRAIALAASLKTSGALLGAPQTKVFLQGGSYGGAAGMLLSALDQHFSTPGGAPPGTTPFPLFSGFLLAGTPLNLRDHLRSNAFRRETNEVLASPDLFPREIGDHGMIRAVLNDAGLAIGDIDLRKFVPTAHVVYQVGSVDSGIVAGANHRFQELTDWFRTNNPRVEMYFKEAGHGDPQLTDDNDLLVQRLVTLCNGTLPPATTLPAPPFDFASDMEAATLPSRSRTVTPSRVLAEYQRPAPSSEPRAHSFDAGGNYWYGDSRGFVHQVSSNPPTILQSHYVGGVVTSLLIKDLDGDTAEELVATTGNGVTGIDTITGAIDFHRPHIEARSIVEGDFYCDGTVTLAYLADDSGGRLHFLDAQGQPRDSFQVGAMNELVAEGVRVLGLSSFGHVFSFELQNDSANNTVVLVADRVSPFLGFIPRAATHNATGQLLVGGNYRQGGGNATVVTLDNFLQPVGTPTVTSLFGIRDIRTTSSGIYVAGGRAEILGGSQTEVAAIPASGAFGSRVERNGSRIRFAANNGMLNYLETPTAKTSYVDAGGALRIATLDDGQLIIRDSNGANPTSAAAPPYAYRFFRPTRLQHAPQSANSSLGEFVSHRLNCETFDPLTNRLFTGRYGHLRSAPFGIAALADLPVAVINGDLGGLPALLEYQTINDIVYGFLFNAPPVDPRPPAPAGPLPFLGVPPTIHPGCYGAYSDEFSALLVGSLRTFRNGATNMQVVSTAGGNVIIGDGNSAPVIVPGLGFGTCLATGEMIGTTGPVIFAGSMTADAQGVFVRLLTPQGTWAAFPHTQPVSGLLIAPNKNRLIVGGVDGSICVYNTTGTCIYNERIGTSHAGFVNDMTITGNQLWVGHSGGWTVLDLTGLL